MRRAQVVIGAGFGDEGKGWLTDYLCSTIDDVDVVVRFNGGAQAGHTVVTPDGRRHVFSHVGSGSFYGIPTFLSQFFVVNPLLFLKELDTLAALGTVPTVYAHPSCIVTTFADMIINQRLENDRGAGRHGSVGVGVNETIERSNLPKLKISMADLWNRTSLESRLAEICGKYAAFRTGKDIHDPEAMIDAFMAACEVAAERIHPLGIGQCNNPIFEGAQGLLLDQNNTQFFPHVTRSNTGMQNVRVLCDQAGIKDVTTWYVSRTYLTRHGAGKLPGEDPKMHYEDDTNVPHAYQGTMRFAPLDAGALLDRCTLDASPGAAFKLALTHCDQLAPPPSLSADLFAYGPTREHARPGNAPTPTRELK